MKATIRAGFFFSFLLSTFFTNGQTDYVDSLRQLIQSTSDDSVRFANYFEIIGSNLGTKQAETFQYLDTLKVLAEKENNPYFFGLVHKAHGFIFQNQNKLDSAIIAFEKALEIIEPLDPPYKKTVFNLQYRIAQIYLAKSNFSQTYEKLRGARELALAENDTTGLAHIANTMGVTHRRAGNLDQALEHFKEATNLYTQVNKPDMASHPLMNMAIIFKTRREYDQALNLYQQALAIHENGDQSDQTTVGYLYQNISSLHHQKKEYELALKYAKLANEKFLKYGKPLEIAFSHLGLGASNNELDKDDEAIQHYHEALRIGKGLLNVEQVAHTGLFDLWSEQNVLDSAIYHMKKVQSIKDSINKKDRIDALAKMEAEFQNERKQQEIEQLELEDQVKEARINQQRWVIGGAILSLLILTAFLINTIRQQRQIKSQHQIISKNLEEKDMLLREIHHRVKNNLQIISSLLTLQSKYIKDESAINAILKGKSRVRSMALIHQNLYQKENVANVNVKSYFTNLFEELIKTYNADQTNIDLQLDIQDTDLDVDTIIPLGLIVNELVTNSLKHAFKDKKFGTLKATFKKEDKEMYLTVADDGLGMNEQKQESGERSFGKMLIQTLTDQINGKLKIDHSKGTRVELAFSSN